MVADDNGDDSRDAATTRVFNPTNLLKFLSGPVFRVLDIMGLGADYSEKSKLRYLVKRGVCDA